MDHIIKTLQVAYRSSLKVLVPVEAEPLHVAPSMVEFQHADIYYRCKDVSDSDSDAIETKKWELAVISDKDSFPAVAKYLGTFFEKGYAYHVLLLNPYD